MNQNNQIPETLTWQASSQQHAPRSPGWYLGFVIISLGLLGFAIYTGSIMTIITFSLIILIVFILSRQTPRQMTYRITKTGIGSANNLYPYKTIKFFWIVYNPPMVKTLNFETSAYINNHISIELGDQDPVEVKIILSQYLPEDLDREESMAEVLARKLKI